jgi:hypothetical protein
VAIGRVSSVKKGNSSRTLVEGFTGAMLSPPLQVRRRSC